MAKGRDISTDIHQFESFEDDFADEFQFTEERAAKARTSIAPILSNLKPDFFTSAFDDFYEDEEERPTIHNSLQQSYQDQTKCANCKGELAAVDGTTCCRSCGTVYDDIKLVDEGAEWRYYGADDSKGSDPTRCGMPVDPLLPNSSLTTVIRGVSNSYMSKIHAWNSIPYKERSLSKTFRDIQEVCNRLLLPNSIFMDAKSLYKILHEIYNTRKLNRISIIGACILFSSKNNGYSITTKRVADALNLKSSDITDGCKTFVKMLYHSNFQYKVETTTIADFVFQYCRQLNMSNTMIRFCTNMADKVKRMEILQEHTNPSIAIGVIYFVSQCWDLPITKKQIHQTCGISEVTITKTYKKLEPYMNDLFFVPFEE